MIFRGGFRLTQGFGINDTAPRLVSFYNSLGLAGHNGLDLCPIERRDYRLLPGPHPSQGQQVPDDLYVRSPLDFELVYAAPDYRNGAGAYVKGRCRVHGKEHFIYFFHLNEWLDKIKIAGRVKAGQIVGVMGGSGNGQQYAFAPHLHLQLRPLNGNQANGYQGAIDPSFLLDL